MTVTTTMMTEQEKIAIAKARIVFVVAVSGCGKSFTGDYLHFMHGYTHIDGDGPVKNCHIPRNKELVDSFFTCFFQHIQKGEDGPEDLWQPYMGEIANHTIQAAKHSDKVILSHATYRQAHREFVIDKLVEGGAKRENITVIELMIDLDVKLKGLYYRTKEQMENSGMTMGDSMRILGWEGVGDVTCAEYIEYQKKEHPELFGNGAFVDIPSGYGKTVDVSGRDMTALDGVDEALGLVGNRNNKTLTFEEIRDNVKTFEQKRDEECSSTGAMEVVVKIVSKLMGGGVDDENKDDTDTDVPIDMEEQNKIAKRRSSLISVEYLERELRRFSLESSCSDEKKKNNMITRRRSSLIQIGKIDLEESNK